MVATAVDVAWGGCRDLRTLAKGGGGVGIPETVLADAEDIAADVTAPDSASCCAARTGLGAEGWDLGEDEVEQDTTEICDVVRSGGSAIREADMEGDDGIGSGD